MIVLLIFFLVVIGWLMIYAVDHPGGNEFWQFTWDSNAGRQLIWIMISGFLFIFVYWIDERFWNTFAYPLYFIGLLSLLGLFLFGSTIKGSTSWYTFGGFSLQPAEFAKFTTLLALSAYLSYYKTNLDQFLHRLTAMGIILLPAFLIALQPDAGSALVYLCLLVVLLRAGFNPVYYGIALVFLAVIISSLIWDSHVVIFAILMVALLVLPVLKNGSPQWLFSALLIGAVSLFVFVQSQILLAFGIAGLGFLFLLVRYVQLHRSQTPALLIPLLLACAAISYSATYSFQEFLKPHQQERINVWLNPSECDPKGSLYNLLQSKMAIGSGGMTGKGYLEGTMTQFDYVPEQSTDFIFSTVGEEFGFLGSALLIVLSFALILRVLFIAEEMRTPFGRYYAYGVAAFFFMHCMVNIGMTMGLLPVIGIPLPFVSYGGSSLIGFTIMFSVLLKLYSEK